MITYDLEDCEGEMNATCNCTLGQNRQAEVVSRFTGRSLGENDDANRFTGEFCECCESGECQKQCFNRFTDGRAKKDMLLSSNNM